MRKIILVVLAVTLIALIALPALAEDAAKPAVQSPIIDLTDLIQAVFALLAALVTYKLIPWIRAKTTDQQQRVLDGVISTAVFAAEQLYGAGNGDKKLTYALDYLKSKGYNIDSQTIKNGVEAAVKALSIQQGVVLNLTGGAE